MTSPPPISTRRPFKRSDAWLCFAINQFATPGLGSFMARKWVAGTIELLLALAGFTLFIFWIAHRFRVSWAELSGTPPPASPEHPLGLWAAIVFGAAWTLSLVTSIRVLLSVRPPAAGPSPPVIRP